MGNALTLRTARLPAEPVRVYPTPIDPSRDIDFEPADDRSIGLGTVAAYALGAWLAVQMLPAITATKHTVSSVISQTIQPNSPQSR